jgi:hypothetical protein
MAKDPVAGGNKDRFCSHRRARHAARIVEVEMAVEIAATSCGSSRLLRFRVESAAKMGCAGRRFKTQIDQNGHSAKFAVAAQRGPGGYDALDRARIRQ